MNKRKSATFTFQFVKPILQTITHLKQYTVLKIRFWSVKCANVTVRKIPSHQAMQAVVVVYETKPNHFKMLLNVFSTTYTYSDYSD